MTIARSCCGKPSHRPRHRSNNKEQVPGQAPSFISAVLGFHPERFVHWMQSPRIWDYDECLDMTAWNSFPWPESVVRTLRIPFAATQECPVSNSLDGRNRVPQVLR